MCKVKKLADLFFADRKQTALTPEFKQFFVTGKVSPVEDVVYIIHICKLIEQQPNLLNDDGIHALIISQPRSQGFSLLNWVGGKRPWHRLVTCPSYTPKSWV